MSTELSEIHDLLKKAGLSESEIAEMVRQKSVEYQGFIDEKGILFLIAKENGINVQNPSIEAELQEDYGQETDYDEFRIPISEVEVGMSDIVLIGNVLAKNPIRNFQRKDGTPGIVGSFILKDDSGQVKITLWGENVSIIQNEFFQEGELVRVVAGYAKKGYRDQLEVHISRKGKVMLSPKDVSPSLIPSGSKGIEITREAVVIDSEPASEDVSFLQVADVSLGMKDINIKGAIESLYPIKIFNKKDGTAGQVRNLLLKDETGKVRMTFWNDDVYSINSLRQGNIAQFTALYPKHNSYNDTIELHFGKSSTMKVLSSSNSSNNNSLSDNSGSDSSAGIVIKIISLHASEGFVRMVEGVIAKIEEFKEINKKDGSTTFLLKILLSDDTSAIRVIVWGDCAVKMHQSIEEGMFLTLGNVAIRFNDFSQEKELSFTKNTTTLFS